MALSISTTQPRQTVGTQHKTRTTVTFDDSYPSGGESLTPNQLGLAVVEEAECFIKSIAATISNAYYDIPNSKLKLFDADSETATADQSGTVVEVVAYGH
jgi:hypothetical protein